MRVKKEVFFLQGRLGGRFCSVHRPELVSGKVLILPPFAEEMNKSRRMLSLAADELAKNGFLVAQIDLSGTGDSAGDFGDVDWSDWLDDVTDCSAWLDEQASDGELVVLALRAGCLLACDWLKTQTSGCNKLVFWQPVASGKQFLAQFLRLKVANAMLTDRDVVSSSKGLRVELAQGRSVEVAGYSVSPGLASGLESSLFSLPDDWQGQVNVLEVLGSGRQAPSPWLAAWRDSLVDQGRVVDVLLVNGPPFWQSSEIEVMPELIELSRRCITGEGLAA